MSNSRLRIQNRLGALNGVLTVESVSRDQRSKQQNKEQEDQESQQTPQEKLEALNTPTATHNPYGESSVAIDQMRIIERLKIEEKALTEGSVISGESEALQEAQEVQTILIQESPPAVETQTDQLSVRANNLLSGKGG